MGVAGVIGRTREVALYERLNDQLSEENSFLRNQILQANNRIDDLKAQLDIQLGINTITETSSPENFQPVGGYESPTKIAKRLSLVSYKKAQDEQNKSVGSDQS